VAGKEEAIVEGLVWNEDEGRGEKKVLVKLYRIYSKSGRVKVVGKTKTKADGSYKFIVEGSKSFLKANFYVRVRKPKGLIFTTVDGKESNINLLTGRTEQFRVKLGRTVSQNACLQSEGTLEGRGPRRTKYQKYRDDACRDAFGEGSMWDGHQVATDDGYTIRCTTPDGLGTVILTTVPLGTTEIDIDEGILPPGSTPIPDLFGGTLVDVGEPPLFCTRKICVVVFENPDRDWCQGPGEPGIEGVDVTFTILTPRTPPNVRPGIVDISFITLVTDSNGQACLPGISVNTIFGPTKVIVDLYDPTLPPLMQNLGTDPTMHLMTCKRTTYWDINGFE